MTPSSATPSWSPWPCCRPCWGSHRRPVDPAGPVWVRILLLHSRWFWGLRLHLVTVTTLQTEPEPAPPVLQTVTARHRVGQRHPQGLARPRAALRPHHRRHRRARPPAHPRPHRRHLAQRRNRPARHALARGPLGIDHLETLRVRPGEPRGTGEAAAEEAEEGRVPRRDRPRLAVRDRQDSAGQMSRRPDCRSRRSVATGDAPPKAEAAAKAAAETDRQMVIRTRRGQHHTRSSAGVHA